MTTDKKTNEALSAEELAAQKVTALKKAIEELGFKVEETEEGLRVSHEK
jgi:hypothetical protein